MKPEKRRGKTITLNDKAILGSLERDQLIAMGHPVPEQLSPYADEKQRIYNYRFVAEHNGRSAILWTKSVDEASDIACKHFGVGVVELGKIVRNGYTWVDGIGRHRVEIDDEFVVIDNQYDFKAKQKEKK